MKPSRMRYCHPSGRYEDCFKPKALPVPDSTLRLCRSAFGFSAPCRGSCCSLQWMEGRNRLQLWGRISWVLTPFASFKGYGYVSFGWFRSAGYLSKWKHETLLHPAQNKLKSPHSKSSLAICHVDPEAASNIDAQKVENWHCILPCNVSQAN